MVKGVMILQIERIQFKEEVPYSVRVEKIKRTPIHWHENVLEIILPIKGSIQVFPSFEQIHVKEGDFWFVNNMHIHHIVSSDDAIVILIHLDLNYFEKHYEYIKYTFFRSNMYNMDSSKSASDNYDDETRKGYKTRFINLLVSVLMDILNDDPMVETLIMDSIYQLVASIINEFLWIKFMRENKDSISPVQLNRYLRIIKYIKENYQEKITVEDIAKGEYITENYFSHFWKDFSFFSFKDRLNYERVIMSELILLTTDKSIYSISESIGFSDVKYYYKHFKKWYGVNPLEHKKRCIEYMAQKPCVSQLNLNDIKDVLDDYINNVILKEYAQNNIWKTTYLFDNFVNLKYLYKLDKIMPQRSPRNVVVDIFNSNNFKTLDNNMYFNWQNIDILVNYSETSDFKLDIKMDCTFLDKEWYEKAVNTFVDSCILRYRIITIEKWQFFITYNSEDTFYMANTVGDIIKKKIPKANIRYFFEI